MKLADVRAKAFAMPLIDPAYPRGPYKFYNREFVVITYRTDAGALREVVPEPLEVASDTVAYEFIRMPDSTGFGDYTETGQVIPVRFRSADGTVQECGYTHAMYLDDNAPIAGGREIWGFPKKLASPKISNESETVVFGCCLIIDVFDQHAHFAPDTPQACRRRQSQDIAGCILRSVMLHLQIKRPGEQLGQPTSRERDVDAIGSDFHPAVQAHEHRFEFVWRLPSQVLPRSLPR
jgi:Acetoacetate decarboxylase (ADC)